MKNQLFLLFLLLGSTTLYAQDFQWSHSIGGSSTENVENLELIGGHVLVSGQFFGTVDFDPGASNDIGNAPSSGSAYIAQFDTTGNYQWKITFEHPNQGQAFIADMEADVNGNLVVLGSHIGDIDLDPGAATVTTAIAASSFIAIYSAQGAYISHFEYSSYVQFNHISIDLQNGLYVCGTFSSPFDADPTSGTDMATPINGHNTAVVSKISLTSNLYQWTRIVGGGLTTGEDIALRSNGGITLAGLYEDSVDLDPSAAKQIRMTQGDADVYLVALNAAGGYAGSNVIGSSFFDGTFNLDRDLQGNFIISIVHYDPIEMNGNGPSTVLQPLFPSSGNSDIVIAKYNSTLDLLWANQFGSENDDDLPAISAAFNQIAITGEVGGYASLSDFNSGTYFDVSSYPSNKAMYILLMDDAGDLVRSYLMEDYPINSNDIVISAVDQLYIVGGYSDTCDFDPGLSASPMIAANGTDGFLMKLQFQSPPNALSEANVLNLEIYPNPSEGWVNLSWEGQSATKIELFNLLGQVVFSQLFENESTTQLNLDFLPAGQYFLRLENAQQVATRRLLLR